MAEHSRGAGGRRRKKFLTAEQKYELWTALVRGDATQRELADRWGVDRSVVVKVSQVAKHGALAALEASKPGKPAAACCRGQHNSCSHPREPPAQV
ncbi:MAG: hypothetical protein KY469_22810, partial [Actinobacteria bacterium]|nr:hypothetical protein [Actinomycetota bacterium]